MRNGYTILLFIFILISTSGFFSSYGFGKNKVQYKNLVWHYNKTPHFHSYFHQNQGDLPAITAQWIENAYTELCKDFNFKHKKPIPLLVFGSPILFEQTNVTPGIIPEGVGGFTESLKNRIVVPFTGSYEELRHVLHHELVHAFQFGILFDQFGGSLFRGNALQMPLWFAEGSAEFLSTGWNCDADMFLMDRAIFGTLPLPGPEMGGYMLYKGGQSFLYFLSSSRGDSIFHNFLTAFRKSKRVTESLEHIYKRSLLELGNEWHQELKRIYWPEIGKREDLAKKGTALTSHIKSRSYLNLKPRISPDGSMVAYYSDAKDFTKIFISDTKGKVHTKIGQHGYGGYFESFQPFRSGMCWSPKSDRIAFITKNRGRNEIRIIDIKHKKHIQTLTPELESISSPDWSPDGKFIVFCGHKQHCTNIYLYNINKKKYTQLTDDIYYDSDPRFSRDGSAIIFAAIDTSGIAGRNMANGRPSSNLFLLELNDKSITQLSSTPWNEKQPCFSPDGNNVVFISDRNGVDNIYIAPITSLDSARALTDIIGGCSNPDWSLEENTLVFSLFQKQGWDIWLIDEPTKKLLDTIPSSTLWVKSRADSTTHYFLPAPIPSDSTDTTGITEILEIDSSQSSDSKGKSITTSKKETGGIIEEEVVTEKDSSFTDTSKALNSISAVDSINVSDSSFRSDTSVLQTEALTDTTDDTASVSLSDSSDTTMLSSKGGTNQIIEDSSLIQNDSVATGSLELINVISVLDSHVISDSSTTPDTSVKQIAELTDTTTDTILVPRAQDSSYITPILPKNMIDYPYRLKLSVDMVSVGMAYSNIYGYAGQGVIVFSDLLGNHQIVLAGNVQGSLDENNIFTFYINSKYRLDFGIGAFYERYYISPTRDYSNLFHDTNAGAILLLRYPFSLFSRIDFNLFYKHIDRVPKDAKLKTDPTREKMSVNITMPSLSYIFDNILWGITGPINGTRAMTTLLAAPPLKAGDASFISLDFDVRNYIHIRRKFVWANRITFGFSEPVGQDESKRRYFLGGNENWIFTINGVNIGEYEKNLPYIIYSSYVVPFRGWKYFDITGTRFAVFNTEFRFPFIKTIDIVWPLPMKIRYINGAFFIDVGNAWDVEDQYDKIPLPQHIYGGIGFGLRANLGIFILRYDIAWKTDWHKYLIGAYNYFSLGAEF